MAGEGTPKPLAIAPTAAHSTIPSPSNMPNPAVNAIMEEEAIFVQPLAMIPASGNNGGLVGATHRSADQPGRPTRGRDIHRPLSAARSPSPLKIAKSRARAQSLYRRPSKETPSPLGPIAKQLFKEGAATGSSAPPKTAQMLVVIFSDFYRQLSFGFQALKTIMHQISLILMSSMSFGALVISGT